MRVSDGQDADPVRRPRWRRKLLLVALLGFVSAEAYLRIRYYEQLKIGSRPLVYDHDNFVGYRYRPNSIADLSCPGINRSTPINAAGYCGTRFDKNKPNGVTRIAVVGVSTGTGIWMNKGEPYPALLQKLLASKGLKAEVLNFSIDGAHRNLAQLRLLERDVLAYKPDVVLVPLKLPLTEHVSHRSQYRGYVYNYGHTGQSAELLSASRKKIQEIVDRIEGRPELNAVYRASFLVRAYFHHKIKNAMETNSMSRFLNEIDAYRTKRINVWTAFGDMSMAGSVQRVQDAALKSRAAGARFIAFRISDTPEGTEQDEQLQRAGIEAICLQLPNDEDYVHSHDGHLNALGHAAVASRLAERIGF